MPRKTITTCYICDKEIKNTVLTKRYVFNKLELEFKLNTETLIDLNKEWLCEDCIVEIITKGK